MDTLESVLQYMTDDVLMLVDGCSTELDHTAWPVHFMKGFKHGCPKSPYRNVALGLQNIWDLFPNYDWYCYLEYDCLVSSERFKANLQMADDRDVWMLGCDGHVDDKDIPLVSAMFKTPLKGSYYLLGACQFFNGHFMKRLIELDFFQRFLNITNSYSEGFMPGYHGYDVSEHLYPTLARHLGGNIGVFSSWDAVEGRWHGRSDVFPIRWRPDIEESAEHYPQASIFHPIKEYDHPIREFHRKVRYASKIQKYCNGVGLVNSTKQERQESC